MKDVNKEVINYYIKLAQKLSKKKRIYFEREADTVYFSDGCFACSFSVERVQEFLTLCGVFNLPTNEDFTAEYNNGNIFHNETSIKNVIMFEDAEENSLMFTGVSCWKRTTNVNIDVFADNENVYFYNAQYTKPMKDKNLYLNGVNKNGYMWAVYSSLDICCLVLPCTKCDGLAKVVELMNKNK
nr:MAG TPA: hypothetical protein [Caudoviricetes sp.]